MVGWEQKFNGVKSVLVVLSSRSMAFDQGGLRNLITHAYPGAAVFFVSTSGDPVGVAGPKQVDLVVDLTPPGARQNPFLPLSFRGRGRFVVGRRSGWFYRRSRYDRIYDESADASIPRDYLEAEAHAQRRVLELSGVALVRHGGTTPDRSKDIGAGSIAGSVR
jgi:hypothetical protein